MMKSIHAAVSRRKFLAASGGAMLPAPGAVNSLAAETDPRVEKVLSRTIAIDMHNHVYPAGTEPRRGPQSLQLLAATNKIVRPNSRSRKNSRRRA
jgi:hypothetical protein